MQLIVGHLKVSNATPATWWETTQDKEPIDYLMARSYFVTLCLESCLYCVES